MDQDVLNVSERDLHKALEKVVDGIIQDPIRAAQLGIIPNGDNKVSKRGQFIVDPSNIEDAENKKMRGYRYKDFGTSGKTLYGWSEGGPVDLVVYNRAEEEKALAAGWSLDPVHGPVGKLDAAPVAVEETRTEVREFAAPGAAQPFEQEADDADAAPVKVRRKPGPKPKVN